MRIEAVLPAARERLAAFLRGRRPAEQLVVFCHSDADGLAAGALFGRSLPRLGFTDVLVVPTHRGESAFSDVARERVRRLRPDALIVTDLGVHAEGVLENVPTLYVDHHQPAGEPPGATIISGYAWDPIPASAWLAYELLRGVAHVDDLSWIAAVGTMSDLGDDASWPELPAIRRQWTTKWLKEAVVLINAARRASAFDVETPLSLLMHASHPREVSEDESRGADRLRAYRAEVYAELQAARRHAPSFSGTGPYALVRMHSACQVHPLIAQQWRGRLPKYAVIAANTGFLPDTVVFSMRTSRTDLNLPQILQAIDLGPGAGHFGYGHDQATGGQMPPAAFDALLAALGFTATRGA
jgi:single-stranded-DNA-specific exonuclease